MYVFWTRLNHSLLVGSHKVTTRVHSNSLALQSRRGQKLANSYKRKQAARKQLSEFYGIQSKTSQNRKLPRAAVCTLIVRMFVPQYSQDKKKYYSSKRKSTPVRLLEMNPKIQFLFPHQRQEIKCFNYSVHCLFYPLFLHPCN